MTRWYPWLIDLLLVTLLVALWVGVHPPLQSEQWMKTAGFGLVVLGYLLIRPRMSTIFEDGRTAREIVGATVVTVGMICLSAVDGDFTWLLCVACPVVWIASTGLRSGIIWNTMMIVSMGVARSVAELKRGELAQQWLFIGLNVVLPLAFSIMIGAIVHAGVQWGIERTELLQELDETSSDLAESYRQLLGSSMPTMSGESPLSPRETEVLTLVAQGLTNRQIAEILFISSATVKTHMEHILDKMGATTRTQAVLCAHQEGLLASSEETLGT